MHSFVAGSENAGSSLWFPTADMASLMASQQEKANISGGSATALLLLIVFYCNFLVKI